MEIEDTRNESPPHRVVITAVQPQVDAGRFPIKRVAGEKVIVEADLLADGQDLLAAVLRYRQPGKDSWAESEMRLVENDRWRGEFRVDGIGIGEFTIEAWIDRFESWRHDLLKRLEAGQDVALELQAGAQLIQETGGRAILAGASAEGKLLTDQAEMLHAATQAASSSVVAEAAGTAAHDERLAALMRRHSLREGATTLTPAVRLDVDRETARFSSWYEMFPRSCAGVPGRHGTFADCERRLPAIAAMGFDVVYLPPIHPIGRIHRKGKNNSPASSPDDPGSPWAIGAAEGGHTAVHPQLGSLEDFSRLVATARELGLEIALDLAFQCAPDHPWVREHPSWFRHRPDGIIQYAENPPKKYEDIYPLDFQSEDWRGLWDALRDIALTWIRQGLRIFRVDNPHTKPFAFWEWLIRSVKESYPEVIFLAEAFTRPKIMHRLAKLGFSLSYTYFTWRNTRWELTQYFTELVRTSDYFRPSLWTNTPDILSEYLQFGGRPAFIARLVLAATLGACYGIYGPAFELCENAPIAPGSEEYLNAEKYEIRNWNLEQPDNLSELISRVNRARRENPALQSNRGLCFHEVDNDQLIAYSKRTEDGSNAVLAVVNLDYHSPQSGWVTLRLEELGLRPQTSFQMHDLLTDTRYLWQGARNYVQLDPARIPAHLFRIRRYVRTENDFDYYM